MALTNAGQKRRLNVSQAREHLWIAKLRRLPDGLFDRSRHEGRGLVDWV
jgi:hypothetical protein